MSQADDTEPDAHLMERYRDGDGSSLEELVARHHGSLVRWFHLQSRSREMAEDLAQEVWVRVIRHRDDYRATARFQTYLFHIARNLWIDRYRSRKAAPGMVSADAPLGGGEDAPSLGSSLPGAEPDPGHQASVHEDAARIRRAIEELPEGLRDVFELGEVQGMRYAEVGSILGIPVGTVKSRMHAAVQRLRAALGVPAAPPRGAGGPGGAGPEGVR
jgi:RNA polymerase sigma-70 factor (ECF subfamily)